MKFYKSKTIKAVSVFSALLIIYFISCGILYLFEPGNFISADLDKFEYSFDGYKIYNKNENSDFYIKQINKSDVTSADDVRLKYVNNTVIAVSADNISYEKINEFVSSSGGKICGYIKWADFYQIEFADIAYDELLNKCSVLEASGLFIEAIPDYFEETPGTACTNSETFSLNTEENYAYSSVNLTEALKYLNSMNNINVGLIDTPVDYTNSLLSVSNSSEYSADCLYSGILGSSSSHGTHVAGIINSQTDASGDGGVFSKACLYSYNGINTSLSYWIANICRMICEQNIKVINISMGYNSYIPVSASLGSAEAIEFIKSESELFSAALEKLIDRGFEFVICAAAGNDYNKTLYKDNSSYFKYSDKKILNSLDIFGIFDSGKVKTNAQYNFIFTYIQNKEVKNRIIVVGSYGESNNYTSIANTGSRIDIAAPGENILSCGINDKKIYMSGTSMSTAFVSATAAMIFGIDENITGENVKNIIISSASEFVQADGFEYPKLNTGKAVSFAVSHTANQ